MIPGTDDTRSRIRHLIAFFLFDLLAFGGVVGVCLFFALSCVFFALACVYSLHWRVCLFFALACVFFALTRSFYSSTPSTPKCTCRFSNPKRDASSLWSRSTQHFFGGVLIPKKYHSVVKYKERLCIYTTLSSIC